MQVHRVDEPIICPQCSSTDVTYYNHDVFGEDWLTIECNNCGTISEEFNPIQCNEEDL